jgi:hypothetical protein
VPCASGAFLFFGDTHSIFGNAYVWFESHAGRVLKIITWLEASNRWSLQRRFDGAEFAQAIRNHIDERLA